jgi:SAM-dependent methyltransferase
MMYTENDYAELIKSYPFRGEIYQPTNKLTLEQRIEGAKKVIDTCKNKKSFYSDRLKDLKSKYEGHDRCFVIGNAPSLNKLNLNLLRDEVTFGVNGIFLKEGFKPTFYVVEDHLVAEDRKVEIDKLSGVTKLFPSYLRYCFDEGKETIFYNHQPRISYPHGFDFSEDASDVTYTGCTVVFSCLQLAYYFGFKEIYVIGVDVDYQIPDDVKKSNDYNVEILDMDSDDPNHFHQDYFGKGFRWHDPQAPKMVESFREAGKVCGKNGVKVFNATPGGKLEEYERVRFEDLFQPKKFGITALANYQRNPTQEFLRVIGKNVSSILEIGSDVDLNVANFISERLDCDFYALNPDPKVLKANKASDRIQVLNESGNKIPMEDSSAGAVISLATFEHVLEIPGLLDEVHRVLEPGGYFYADFGPLWTCAVGHHVYAKFEDKEARFWKPSRNPVPDFLHLVADEEEMAEELRKGPCDDRLIPNIIDWIYRRKEINRIGFYEYREMFLGSPFEVQYIHGRPRPQSLPPNQEIRARLDAKYGSHGFCYHAYIDVLLRKKK